MIRLFLQTDAMASGLQIIQYNLKESGGADSSRLDSSPKTKFPEDRTPIFCEWNAALHKKIGSLKGLNLNNVIDLRSLPGPVSSSCGRYVVAELLRTVSQFVSCQWLHSLATWSTCGSNIYLAWTVLARPYIKFKPSLPLLIIVIPYLPRCLDYASDQIFTTATRSSRRDFSCSKKNHSILSSLSHSLNFKPLFLLSPSLS